MPTDAEFRPATPEAMQLDRLLDQFEEAWQSGSPPSLETFLAGLSEINSAFRCRLLPELIKIDLDHRWRLQSTSPGSTSTGRSLLDDYAKRFPELGPVGELPVSLVREEYWVRHCWGDRPTADEYLARFPGRAELVRAALAEADAELTQEPGHAPSVSPPPVIARGPLTTSDDLCDALRALGLLDAEQLDQFQELKQDAQFRDARAMAQELVRRDWLTQYQFEQLFRGEGISLRFGPYVIRQRIGAGVTGEVFAARPVDGGPLLALKVIRRELLDRPEAVRRFYQESRAAHRLKHPNVVCALGAGSVGGTHFLAMEYVAGVDLDQRVKQSGPLPIDEAAAYVRQAGLGLQHIHEHGLVHRDIKPANLVVTGNSERGVRSEENSSALRAPSSALVKILDLGLARWQRAMDGPTLSTLTQEGTVMGTPDYMAPEQAADAHAVDIRADIYSLGCTFYYLLTGRPPFPGGTFIQKVDRHRWEEPSPVEQLRPDVPARLVAILHRMLAKEPSERWQTPAELVAAFEPGAIIPEAARPVRISRRRWLATVAVAAAGATPLAYLAWHRYRSTDSPLSPFDVLAGRGVPDLQRVPGQPAELVAVLGDHRLRQWGLVWSVAFSRDGRLLATAGEDWRVRLWDVATGRERLALSAPPVNCLAFSPDGRYLATSGWGRGVRLWDAAQGFELGGVSDNASYLAVDFTADSKTLLAGRNDGGVIFWDVDARKVAASFPKEHAGSVYAVAGSPDARVVASAGADGVVKLWDVPGRSVRAAISTDAVAIRSISFSPDGGTLALARVDSLVQLSDVKTTKEVAVLRGHDSPVRSVAFAPDGRTLASGSDSPTQPMILWDANSRKRLATLWTSDGSGIFPLAFSPDSATLASGGLNGAVRLWDVAGRKERPLDDTQPPINTFAVSPDGGTLALGSLTNPGRLLDVASGAVTPIRDEAGDALAVAFAPDGTVGASGGKTGITLWNPATGTVQGRLSRQGMRVTCLAFSLDGQLLAAGSSAHLNPKAPGELHLWDMSSREGRTFGLTPKGGIMSVAFGKLLAAACGDGVVYVWDVAHDEQPHRLIDHTAPVRGVAYSPDGRLASASDDGTVKLWDPTSGTNLDTLRSRRDGIVAVAWSQDGTLLAGAGTRGEVTVWHVGSRERRHEWELPGAVSQVAFAPDGHYLLVRNGNGTVYVLRLAAPSAADKS